MQRVKKACFDTQQSIESLKAPALAKAVTCGTESMILEDETSSLEKTDEEIIF